MTDVFALIKAGGGTVDFLDSTKFKSMIPGGQSFKKDPIMTEEYTQQRDGQILLKTYIIFGYNISMDMYIRGTSYQGALANKAALEAMIASAVAFSGSGEVGSVTLTHQRFDQATAEVYNVVGGVYTTKDATGLTSRGEFGSLKLTVTVA